MGLLGKRDFRSHGPLVTADDRKAFLARIVRDHGHGLRRYLASRMRRAPSDVHDLMQEVYLRLLRMPRHEAVRNPQAYLFTVAHHVLYEYRIRQSSAPEAIEIADLVVEVESHAFHDPQNQLAARQELEVIDESLRQLSPRVHAAFVLHRRFGFSLHEIAQHFGVSQPMVKKYLAKAVLHCKTHFEGAKP